MGAAANAAQPAAPLAPNDVSILFPTPQKADELPGFIAIADLVDATGARLVDDPTFKQFIDISQSKDSEIVVPGGAKVQIGFPDNVRDIKAWFIAGIRVDVGAPGLSPEMAQVFGQIPQVRLILQPVTREAGGKLKVHDRAAHMIFSFVKKLSDVQETCAVAPMVRRVEPDLVSFRAALADFVALRDDLATGALGGVSIVTSGPLDVHPGLKGASRIAVRDRIKSILEKHLKPTQVGAMAIMGIPATQSEPWIFMALKRQGGTLAAVGSPALDGQSKAELLRFVGAKVLPEPKSDNQNATFTTCFRLPNTRTGVSTAELMATAATADRTREVTGIVADPRKSHFFNTDCVSCHTETRLFRTKLPGEPIPGIVEAVLPQFRWNVRNFGWGLDTAGFKPTITRRTANETDEVVTAANKLLAAAPD
jgi:hypothetical protein